MIVTWREVKEATADFGKVSVCIIDDHELLQGADRFTYVGCKREEDADLVLRGRGLRYLVIKDKHGLFRYRKSGLPWVEISKKSPPDKRYILLRGPSHVEDQPDYVVVAKRDEKIRPKRGEGKHRWVLVGTGKPLSDMYSSQPTHWMEWVDRPKKGGGLAGILGL